MTGKSAPFPTKDQIVEFIRESPGRVGKREIARAFHLDAEQKKELKKVLRALSLEGTIEKRRGRRFREPGALPEVAVLVVSGLDPDGEVLARPLNWDQADPPPVIYMAPEKRGHPAMGTGDRVLARLAPAGERTYEARVIRRLTGAPDQVLGIYERVLDQGRIKPIDKRARNEFAVPPHETLDARSGELVRAEVISGGRRFGQHQARVVERLGSIHGPHAVSLMSIHERDIPTEFAPEALAAAKAAGPAPLDRREDLRGLPLVTIDGEDARDFDDAVWAEADPDSANPGGWNLIVAIADVAWYVRPGEPLDVAAYERGNSVYFPDRMVPMLPEALCTGWCSLRPAEERPCLAAHLTIDAEGTLVRHRFTRAVMRSVARLTYTQVQRAWDGTPDETTLPLAAGVIAPLYRAYEALARNRKARGVLELDLPERQVVIGGDGEVRGVVVRPRWDSHRLIEEFMITANVAAAETLERMKLPCMYRIHDQPAKDKLDALRDFLDSIGLRLAKGQVIFPKHFNHILAKVAGTPNERLVNEVILRSQAQACYAPDNIGHFGLALRRYCHFTSPIRRYADLLVHRALIQGMRAGEGALEEDRLDFAAIGEHISATERRAAAAERDAVDRFTAAFLASKVGAVLSGRITGVTRFGLFVALSESGGDGLVPIATLPDDYYVHDEAGHRLVGRHNGREYRLGDEVDALLREADPITGGLILNLVEDAPSPMRVHPPGRPPGRRRRQR